VLLRFFEVDNEADERMLLRLQQELSHWQSLCDQAGMAEPIPLTVVREHWLSGLESSGLQQRFFGGGVQFSTLMPMRAIPFKGLCLLGMNDGAYPRQSTPRDFDLMSLHWRAGDRSRREDDRYLFLEAFLSAREKLYISWQGRRSTDNQKMPPSVLVSQLRDTLKSRFTPETSAVLQPLQAFSAKYFLPQSEFLTYADDWEKAQQYSIVSNTPSAESESSALAFPAISEWPLKECMRLLKQPVEVYWRSRLGVQLNGPEEALLEDENFVLDGLGRYSLGRSLLEAPNIDEQLEAEKLLGQLPMGAAGQMLLKQQYDAAQKVKERASAYWLEYAYELPTQTIAVDVAMPWGKVQVTAEVSALRQSLSPANHSIDLDHFLQAPQSPPTLQISTRPGAVATGHRDQQSARADILIQLWPQHVLLSAAGWNIQSVLVGLDGVTVLQPLSEQSAQKLLTQWLMVYAQAWTQPLPVTFKAGLAFVTEQISLQRASQGGVNEGSAVTSDVLSQDGITELALEKARKEFSDDFSESTDLARSLYVQRSFDHFDAIAEGLPIWAPLLYEGLIHAAAMEGDAA
jgi:exodeoxyribonuclease V gamma subunit